MNITEPIYDTKSWRRLGRGRILQFFATDDEVQGWLLTALPHEYSPYTLVGADLVKFGKTYSQRAFEFDITELKKAMYEKDEVRWQYWIRSRVITPKLDFERVERISWMLSFSGLVGLHHGSYLKNIGRAESSIGIVDKVINDNTVEVLKHKEYLKIFNAFKRQIKKKLCYSSIWKTKDGVEYEDKSLQLMTEEAVKAYEAGVLLKNAPGRKLKNNFVTKTTW